MTPRRSAAALPTEVEMAFRDARTTKAQRNAYIQALFEAGWSRKSIADAIGLTVQRVWQIATRDDLSVQIGLNRFPVPVPPINRSVTLSWTDKSGLGGLYARKTTLEMALSQIESSTMFNTLWWIDQMPASTKEQRDKP